MVLTRLAGWALSSFGAAPPFGGGGGGTFIIIIMIPQHQQKKNIFLSSCSRFLGSSAAACSGRAMIRDL